MGTNLKMAQDLLELGATTNFVRSSRVYIDPDRKRIFRRSKNPKGKLTSGASSAHTWNDDGSMGIRARGGAYIRANY